MIWEDMAHDMGDMAHDMGDMAHDMGTSVMAPQSVQCHKLYDTCGALRVPCSVDATRACRIKMGG